MTTRTGTKTTMKRQLTKKEKLDRVNKFVMSQTKASISGARYAGYGATYKIAIANDTTVDDELLRKMVRERIEENQRNQSRTIQQSKQSSGR